MGQTQSATEVPGRWGELPGPLVRSVLAFLRAGDAPAVATSFRAWRAADGYWRQLYAWRWGDDAHDEPGWALPDGIVPGTWRAHWLERHALGEHWARGLFLRARGHVELGARCLAVALRTHVVVGTTTDRLALYHLPLAEHAALAPEFVGAPVGLGGVLCVAVASATSEPGVVVLAGGANGEVRIFRWPGTTPRRRRQCWQLLDSFAAHGDEHGSICAPWRAPTGAGNQGQDQDRDQGPGRVRGHHCEDRQACRHVVAIVCRRRLLAAATRAGHVRVWDRIDGALLHALWAPGSHGPLAFDGPCRRLFRASDGLGVWAWRLVLADAGATGVCCGASASDLPLGTHLSSAGRHPVDWCAYDAVLGGLYMGGPSEQMLTLVHESADGRPARADLWQRSVSQAAPSRSGLCGPHRLLECGTDALRITSLGRAQRHPVTYALPLPAGKGGVLALATSPRHIVCLLPDDELLVFHAHSHGTFPCARPALEGPTVSRLFP